MTITKPTILIVENNPETRKILRTTLETGGYAVVEAAEGKMALDYVQKMKPDLILQDLELPDMDGFELNRRLRLLPNGADLPILALSGFLETQPGTKFTTSLIKPIEPAQVLQVVSNYLPLFPVTHCRRGERTVYFTR